ncbi:aldehyde dehydrogenase (NAD+) [Arthrobacter stackebrandtii]|uniref:Aldehyde dehydrogenase (NAD+) n=1 Tax=Arthrobacter stackebrandtii TaxID=272161 RepID=A0ABS4YU52_9MICC|nr:aldehyde dehydrogenase family protein [Arthrobacter stackebrandtii]MBP2411942.1 aldehyde dehydrogenase (NAD+) [Arthrobacter stackebrandtii]PYG99799.1 aldehyde dehydrogenase [Arthrobacter stackebrandtii]
MTTQTPASQAHAVTDHPMWIGGEPVESLGGQWHDVHNPARRESVIARVPAGTVEDVDRAVAAARAAFPAWRAQHFTARALALNAIADELESRIEEFAHLTALDTGNALRTQARPEATSLVAMFRYFAGAAAEVKGVTLPAGDNQLQYTRLEPLGVVAAILPWNSPLLVAAFKVPAALAAGNTVLLKAAEDAPLTILLLAQVCNNHLPAGVVNALTGSGSVIGEAMALHPGVDKVSFTGSTEVGRRVGGHAGERLAHVSLELGGKNPSVVFPDALSSHSPSLTAADDDELYQGLLLASRFTRQGQSCTAGSRLYVHEDIFEELVGTLSARLDALVVGDPLDEATDMGAIINAKQHTAINGFLEEGRSTAGMKAVIGGNAPQEGPLTEGYYHLPTLFTGARNDFRIAREEIFGPVLVAIPWRDVDEVVAMANDTNYGLAAYVWSHNLDDALNTAHRIDAGWVQVNQGGGQVPGQSYGGYKQSGLGREVSVEGMLAGFTQTKQINVKLRGTRA